MTIDIKITIIKDHPGIFSFLTSMYYESDEEIKDDIKKITDDSLKFRERWVFRGTDVSRFKDGVDPKLIDKFLVWAAEGFTNSLNKNMAINEIEVFTQELHLCLDLMKKYFYKE